MANDSTTGFGFRTSMTLGNTPATSGQSEYKIKSGLGVGIFQNYTNASHALMVGVFNGAFYIDNSTSKPTFANSVAASTTFGTDYNTGSDDGIGFVNDNPQQEYVCKADAAVAQTAIGTVFNCNNFTAGDAKSGQSTVTLDITSAAETKMFRVVGSANEIGNDDMASAGANVRVAWNSASNLYQ